MILCNYKYLDNNKNVFMLILFIIALLCGRSALEGFFQNKKLCSRLYKENKNKSVSIIRNFINKSTCKSIIQEAEDYAAVHEWTTDRHDNYPTTDNEITYEWNTYNPICNYIHSKIFRELKRMYNVNPNELGINELFVAKYENKKNKQSSLGSHVDGSEFSFVIALNDNFQGGGTHFVESNRTYQLEAGDCLVFSGQNRHKGVKVTSGTRYILTGFLNYKSHNYCKEVLNVT
jgi:hypothetical protein